MIGNEKDLEVYEYWKQSKSKQYDGIPRMKIPLSKLSNDELCGILTEWISTDLNHSKYLEKFQDAFEDNQLNGELMISLNATTAKNMVIAQLILYLIFIKQ